MISKKLWVPAKVLDASDRSYSTILLDLFAGAQKEILISLYLIEPEDKASEAHPVNRLLEALHAALLRGVSVSLYLNTNFRFYPNSKIAEGRYFEKLVAAGLKITLLAASRRLHDKLIVVDARYVVEGSMNWSVAALQNNFESVSVIQSPAYASKKIKRFELLPQTAVSDERSKDLPLLKLPEKVAFPARLLDRDFLSQMIRSSDERSLDIYLILLGQAAACGERSFSVDLETLAATLEFPKNWSRSQCRRQILKTLRKLKNVYHLLEAAFPYAKNPKITMREIDGPVFSAPSWMLEPAYLARESSGKIFLNLTGEYLKTQGRDISAIPAADLEREFGVGSNTLLLARRNTPTPVPFPQVPGSR